MLAEAHAAAADLLGCVPSEVVFGPNMTTLTFALSRAIGHELAQGDEIVVTQLDHDANVAPWKALEERGVVIRTADIRIPDCTLDLNHLRGQINSRTRLVAVGYASNAVGTINDVAAIGRLAHDAGAMVFVDAVHYAPHGPIDVRALQCDFLACSAYKFFGPHVGMLYGKAGHLTRLQPYKVRPAADQIPDRWETGTQNHEGLAGLIASIGYLADLGRRHAPEAALDRRGALLAAMHSIQTYERELCGRLLAGLEAIPGIRIYGIRDQPDPCRRLQHHRRLRHDRDRRQEHHSQGQRHLNDPRSLRSGRCGSRVRSHRHRGGGRRVGREQRDRQQCRGVDFQRDNRHDQPRRHPD
jgi:cysteine desulfurase family protein (TIGR01976 family)